METALVVARPTWLLVLPPLLHDPSCSEARLSLFIHFFGDKLHEISVDTFFCRKEEFFVFFLASLSPQNRAFVLFCFWNWRETAAAAGCVL